MECSAPAGLLKEIALLPSIFASKVVRPPVAFEWRFRLMYPDLALGWHNLQDPPLFVFSKSPEFNISSTSSLV